MPLKCKVGGSAGSGQPLMRRAYYIVLPRKCKLPLRNGRRFPKVSGSFTGVSFVPGKASSGVWAEAYPPQADRTTG
jgi:hypothetical protein